MTNPKDTVERVARAIADAWNKAVGLPPAWWGDGEWNKSDLVLTPADRDRYRDLARAALDASGNDELVEALKPFAKAGELFPGPPTDFDQCIYNPAAGEEYALNGNDLRRAAKAYAAAITRTQEQSDG